MDLEPIKPEEEEEEKMIMMFRLISHAFVLREMALTFDDRHHTTLTVLYVMQTDITAY